MFAWIAFYLMAIATIGQANRKGNSGLALWSMIGTVLLYVRAITQYIE